MSKKIIILSQNIEDGEALRDRYFADSLYEIKLTSNKEIVCNTISKSKNDIFAFVLLLNEFEMQTISDFGTELYPEKGSPHLYFILTKTSLPNQFAVYFYDFPLIAVDDYGIQSITKRLTALKEVA